MMLNRLPLRLRCTDLVADGIESVGDFGNQNHVATARDARGEREPARGAPHDFEEHDTMMRGGGGVKFIDRFGGGRDGGVETEREIGAAHVVVDGFGDADDAQAELGHFMGALERAVAADGNQRIELEFAVIADDVAGGVAGAFG